MFGANWTHGKKCSFCTILMSKNAKKKNAYKSFIMDISHHSHFEFKGGFGSIFIDSMFCNDVIAGSVGLDGKPNP